MTTERLEAFSDGVFAFAITLLVLNITVPQLPSGEHHPSAAWLWHELGKNWPDYLAYAISFLVIAIMWTNHHALFLRLRTMDRHFIMFNMLLLMGTVLIPFSTALIARFPGEVPSAFVYGFVLTWTASAFYLIINHIVKTPGSHEFEAAELRTTVRRYTIGLAVYSSAMLVALFAPLISIAAYAVIALYFFIPGGVDKRSDHDEFANVRHPPAT